jgi:adenine-specific DNA-methyltransferase
MHQKHIDGNLRKRIVIKNKKQIFGQYFTSRTIADFMVNLISSSKEELEILDPGAGTGVFLESLKERDYKKITGYEIDPDLYKVINNSFPQFDLKLTNFLRSPTEEKFDVIIGNPPYVHWNDIEKDSLDILQNNEFWKPYINGEWDLLYAFIIWSVEKLNENGEIIFIVPYYWFNSTYAYTLRKYLSDNGYFRLIIHMGEYKLFPDCAPNNIIFRYTKSKAPEKYKGKIKVIEFNQRTGEIEDILERIKNLLSKEVDDDFISERDDFRFFFQDNFSSNIFWSLMHSKEKNLIESIEKSSLRNIPSINLENFRDNKIITSQSSDERVPVNHLLDSKDIRQLNLNPKKLLKINGRYYSKEHKTEYLKLKQILNVGVGMVTGFDKAFVINENIISSLTEEEKDLIYYFVKGKSCHRYKLEGAIPYIFADGIENEKELEVKYPNIYNYLIQHKRELNSRYKSKRIKFFQWATVRNLELFKENLNKEKVFVPCLDRHKKSRFSFTIEPYYGSGDVLVITRKKYPKIKESLKYICAWLNSERLNTWYRLKGTKRGQRTSYTQTRVEEFPIRLINWEDSEEIRIYEEIIHYFDKILLLKEENINNLENRIDKLITSLIVNS